MTWPVTGVHPGGRPEHRPPFSAAPGGQEGGSVKLYIRRPTVAKVAQALAGHPDQDVQALVRHLEAKAAQESRFLTADELEAILDVVDAWIEAARRNGGGLDLQVVFRKIQGARPKLVSFLDSTRKREAQGRDLDEDGD